MEEYKEVLQKQDYKCAICEVETNRGLPKSGNWFVVDHDHKSGRIRGLLCSNCNTALGLFLDNPEHIKSAIEYLEKYK